MNLSHDSSFLPSLVEMDSLTDLPEELKPFYPLGDEDGLEVDLQTPAGCEYPSASSSPFFEEEEDGGSASLNEEVASTLVSPPLAHEDRLFDPTSSPSLSLTPTPLESPLAQLEVVLLDYCSTAAYDNNDETQQPPPIVPLEVSRDLTSGDESLTFPPYAAFTAPPATLHQPGSPQASTVEEEERPIFEVLSHRLWPLPAGMLVRGLNNFIVVRVGNPCDMVRIGGSRVNFQVPVIEGVAASNAANGWRAVQAEPSQANKPSVPFFSFSLSYEETMEERNEREKNGKKKRKVRWTPIILHFGEHKVLAVVAFKDRDLDERMFEMLSSAMAELAATTPTLDIVLRLYESAELAYWMDKGLWDARKITPTEPQEPCKKKQRKQPQSSVVSYNGLQQQEAWARLFANQREDLIRKVTATGTFSQPTWCLYWDLQKLRRKGNLKLNKNTLLYLFLKENEVFRRAPHYVEWVLLPERKKLREEPYLSLLLLKRDGTRRIFRYEAGKKEYVEGDLENRQHFSTTTLNRVLDEEGEDEFLQTGSSSSFSSSHNSITTQQREQP